MKGATEGQNGNRALAQGMMLKSRSTDGFIYALPLDHVSQHTKYRLEKFEVGQKGPGKVLMLFGVTGSGAYCSILE